MTITQLQVLIKTGWRLGSFTKAARVLKYDANQHVSHAISSIESELGVTILIRDKRQGLLVNGCRKQILVHIREILNGVEKIWNKKLRWRKDTKWGRFELGVFRVLLHILTENDKPL